MRTDLAVTKMSSERVAVRPIVDRMTHACEYITFDNNCIWPGTDTRPQFPVDQIVVVLMKCTMTKLHFNWSIWILLDSPDKGISDIFPDESLDKYSTMIVTGHSKCSLEYYGWRCLVLIVTICGMLGKENIFYVCTLFRSYKSSHMFSFWCTCNCTFLRFTNVLLRLWNSIAISLFKTYRRELLRIS